MIGLDFLQAIPDEKYKKVAQMLDIPASKIPIGFILLKSGTITKMRPKNTMRNIIISGIFILWSPLMMLTSNIWIGNVKNMIAASETGIKFIDPT